MSETFEQWMSANCIPPENYSLLQYSRYLEGWRNSMPWAYAGMSLAYDSWAESKWDEVGNKELLTQAWKEGLALKVNALYHKHDKRWLHASPQEAADFALTIRPTICALILMARGMYHE